MIFGKMLFIRKSCGVFDIRIKARYNALLNSSMPMIIPKLKEKIITNNEAIVLTIIIANMEMGSPKMIARFLMFL